MEIIPTKYSRVPVVAYLKVDSEVCAEHALADGRVYSRGSTFGKNVLHGCQIMLSDWPIRVLFYSEALIQ